MPNMGPLVDATAGHEMFSFMDGYSGYNQIKMNPVDAEKTAFRTPIGNFYYTHSDAFWFKECWCYLSTCYDCYFS